MTSLIPVNRTDASRWLDGFLEHRLQQFGAYEDAISTQHRVMWHGVLTPMLNCGLLTPQQVIDRTMDCAGEAMIPSIPSRIPASDHWLARVHGSDVPPSWRHAHQQFLELRGPADPLSVLRRHHRTAVDDAIHHALSTGYCHHIERLMLLGNVMLLCSFHPTRIYTWFMELFIDAYDWVMVPNVYGMSQFTDGGIFTTKPYLSGSNYVRKMSDYRKGDWCEVWDGLFWSFIQRHGDLFPQPVPPGDDGNLDRMAPDVLLAHQRRAG